MGNVYRIEKLNKRMIHVLGGTELDGPRLCHALRTACNFKVTNCLFLELFILYFQAMVDCEQLKPRKVKTTNKGVEH